MRDLTKKGMARKGEEALSADRKREASPKQRTQKDERVLVDGGDKGNRHDTQKIKVGTARRRRQMGGGGVEFGPPLTAVP